jgi:hypothetical protein
VEIADDVWLAMIVDGLELRGVRLPLSGRGVQVVQRVPDLVAHDVRGGRQPGPHDELALSVRPGAGVPCGAARRERDPAQGTHLIELRNAPRAYEDPGQAIGELLLEVPGQLR